MDVKPLWSILFFVMLLTLGIGSMIGTFECVRTTIIDLQIIPLRKEITGGKDNFLEVLTTESFFKTLQGF